MMMGKSSNARMRSINRSHAVGGVNASIQQYSSIENKQAASNTLELRSKTRQEKSSNKLANDRVTKATKQNKDLSSDVIMRAKLGHASRSPDVDDRMSVPSQLSDDMWGEVPKYQAYLQEENKRKERETFLKKRSLVKNTLEQQMQDRLKEKQKEREREREMDNMILKRAKEEIEQDKRKKEELIAKTLAAKDERDRQLRLAQNHKQNQF
jgi:hypothetical protein